MGGMIAEPSGGMPVKKWQVFGFALHLAQIGKKHEQTKPLKGRMGRSEQLVSRESRHVALCDSS